MQQTFSSGEQLTIMLLCKACFLCCSSGKIHCYIDKGSAAMTLQQGHNDQPVSCKRMHTVHTSGDAMLL